MINESGDIPAKLGMSSLAKEWPIWRESFIEYMTKSGKNADPEHKKIETFLLLIGEPARNIYNNLFLDQQQGQQQTEELDKTLTYSLQTVLTSFDFFCIPTQIARIESYKFNKIVQKKKQSFVDFEKELRKQIQYCNFKCACGKLYEERILIDRIIIGLKNKNLQLELLKSSNTNLKNIIDICNTWEEIENYQENNTKTDPNQDGVHKGFKGTLAHHLAFGHVVQIVANTFESASKCQINLLTSNVPEADVGLSLIVYFDENQIGRNWRMQGVWDKEDRYIYHSDTPQNPIIAGEFFNIYILCGNDRFHISINNRPFCTYNYRFPISNLRVVEICDQIEDIKQVDHRIVFPSTWPPIQSPDYLKAFSSDTPILFTPGHILTITARCFGNNKGQLIIKFMDSDTKREELHFNLRFEHKVVVRNSMNQILQFGKEERHGGFPFVFNQEFKLNIIFREREFVFEVDGIHFTKYAYRSPNILQNLVGFKVTTIDGMKVHVSAVNHKHRLHK